jgi:hypothetical protein
MDKVGNGQKRLSATGAHSAPLWGAIFRGRIARAVLYLVLFVFYARAREDCQQSLGWRGFAGSLPKWVFLHFPGLFLHFPG